MLGQLGEGGRRREGRFKTVYGYKFTVRPCRGVPAKQQAKNLSKPSGRDESNRNQPLIMATTKERRSALENWATAFPSFSIWKDKFLIQRVGPLIAGICLDHTRDPKIYRPTFFFHNLLVEWPVLTLGYGAPVLHRVVARLLKYDQSVSEVAAQFREQVESTRCPVSFEIFVRHIRDARWEFFGPQAVYLPHALRDMIAVGSYLDDGDYYRACLDAACTRLAAIPNLSLHIVGSINAWRGDVESLIASCADALVERHQVSLRLPSMAKMNMEYLRPNDFPDSI
jgi:hypothetical protein